MSRQRVLATALVCVFGLTACAPAGLDGTPETTPSPTTSSPDAPSTPTSHAPKPTSPAPGTSTPAPSVTPPSTPTAAPPTPSSAPPTTTPQGGLAPGSNHNVAANDYAHPATDVQTWLHGQDLPPEKLVFLTFDDGPNHTITPQVLDALDAGGVPATFFVVGSNLGAAPDMLVEEVARGNAVALHSWSHDFDLLYPDKTADPARVAKEFDDTLAGVRQVLGAEFATGAWRYPGGHGSWQGMAAADAALAERGASWIDWNAITGDAEPKKRRPTTVEEMVAHAVEPIVQGKQVVVLLAHDSNKKELTLESLPEIISAYRDADYSFGVIS